MMLDEAPIAMGIDHPNVARTRADLWSLGANDANDANDAARLVAKRPKTPSSDGARVSRAPRGRRT